MFKHFRSLFFTGLLVLLPSLISFQLLWWGFRKTDAILGYFFGRYFNLTIPGLGLITLIVLITLTGMVARHYLGKKLIAIGESILKRIPILSGIYGTTKQIADSFTNKEKSAFQKVVLVEYPRKGIYSPGFLTGEAFSEATSKLGKEMVNVFIPTVPNPTTGFLILVPKAEVITLEMSVEDGFKLLLSAGVIRPN